MSQTAVGRLWLIGCGNMGGAMLRRWLASGVDPASITVIDPGGPVVPEGVKLCSELPYSSDGCGVDTLVLAIKPQQLDTLFGDDARVGALAPSLLISILAGIEVRSLAARFAADAIVRAMPNLPVSIGKGVTALYTESAGAEAKATAQALMGPLGLVEWIADESLFDAVTALSGCGPGFVYRFIDALARAGAQLGLPAEQAQRLALATVEGSALMAAEAADPPSVLADRVASPGGMTRAGLDVLDEGGALNDLVRRTLEAAQRRGEEMAEAARKGG